jgi:hypothetical protein
MRKCATLGCKAQATQEIHFVFRGEPMTEPVCTPCAESYERRPALAGLTRKPLGG